MQHDILAVSLVRAVYVTLGGPKEPDQLWGALVMQLLGVEFIGVPPA